MTTLKAKIKYIREIDKKYPLIKARPEDIKKKYQKYGDELSENEDKIRKEFSEIYLKDLKPNNKMTRERKIDIIDKISNYEILSLDEIPELNKSDKKVSKVKENKPLTINQQNKIIRQIPDDMFTKTEILQIVKHIRDGSMIDIEQLPEPTKKQPKAKLSDVVIDKNKK